MPFEGVSRRQVSAALRRRTPRGTFEPVPFDPEMAGYICQQLATGIGLRAICKDPSMPSEGNVRHWVRMYPDFAKDFVRAREIGLQSIAEEIIEISDESILFEGEPNNALVQQARLKSDNRKWLLAKLMPQQFGDKVTQEIVGSGDQPLVTRIELVPVEPRRLSHQSDDD